jgi:hypothetical protein
MTGDGRTMHSAKAESKGCKQREAEIRKLGATKLPQKGG